MDSGTSIPALARDGMKQNSNKSPRHGFSKEYMGSILINDPDDKVN